MADPITTAFVTEFKTNTALLLQQQDSRLAQAVTQYNLVGEAAEVLEQFGTTNAVSGLPRHADTPVIDVPQDRRWCYPVDYDWGHMIDKQDQLRLLIDPKSPVTLAGVAAMNRAKDDQIVQAMFGTAKTGKNGSTSTTFPAGNIIANDFGGSAATGMNVAKLREARRLLRRAEVEFETEQVYAALPADKENDLLAEAQVINSDYQAGNAVIRDGRLMGLLGIEFIHSERFQGGAANTNSAIQVPVWCKNGVALGVWNDIKANVAEVPTKRWNWLVGMSMTLGATRLEEARVIQILNV